MQAQEIVTHDLRRTAYHEAGHLVVLFALGGNGCIRIDDPDTSDLHKTSAFAGRVCVYQSSPYTRATVLVGLAGTVAAMMESDGPVEFDHWSFSESLDMGLIELSSSDAEWAKGFTDEDVEAVYNLLLEHWREVDHHAQSEIGKFDLMEQGGAYDA